MYANQMHAYPMQANAPINAPMQQSMSQPIQVAPVEPFVYAAVRGLIGSRVVIDTTRGPVNGILIDAKPDHVVIQERDSTFFVRLCEVVWIMPETGK